MSSAIVLAPLCLVGILTLSGLAKRNHTASTRSVIRLLELPHAAQAQWVAPTLPVAEIVLAALLLLAPAPLFWVPAVAAALLMLTYWAVIARAMRFTPRPSCGCFGQIGDQRVTGRTLARNTVLVLGGVLTVWIAADGESTLSLLGQFDLADAGWLAGTALTVLLTWFIVHRPSGDKRAEAIAAAAAAQAERDQEAGIEQEYLRSVVPHTVVLDSDGTPLTLRETALYRAQLLVFVNCYCPSTTAVAEALARWRADIPAIAVSLVWSVPAIPLHSADGTAIDVGDYYVDHRAVAWSALSLGNSPSAVLIGTDAMLAGGPVSGLDEIEEMVAEVAEVLGGLDAQADEPEHPSDAESGDTDSSQASTPGQR